MPAAIDSNIVWGLIQGDEHLQEQAASAGEIWLPLPVVGEARYAVLSSGRRRENHARLEEFLRTVRVPEMGMVTAQRYAEVRMALRRKARPIPENDMWIAAVCLEHGLPLATRDAHLDEVEGLRVLRWQRRSGLHPRGRVLRSRKTGSGGGG